MESIRVVRKVKSSVIRLKELEKFKDEQVEILIRRVAERSNRKPNKQKLLAISVWNIRESDIKVRSWKIKGY